MLHNSIPVVMYHHVSPADRELNVYPELFEDHLRTLSKKGWKTLSGDEFLFYIENPEDRPEKCVLLTFDDGFADNYVYAYPILKKYNMKAMLFIATDFIEDADLNRDSFVPLSHNDAWKLAFTERRSEAMCTWREIREMDKSGAFDIQSHGLSHNTPYYITDKQYEVLKEDLAGGKRVLEERLSKKIFHLAWPKGHYDKEGLRIAEELGYRALYTTDRGTNTSANMNMIRRLPVKCKNGKWLTGKLPIYSSTLLSKLYLAVRTGI
ncbi:MAG: polysaccharide deacetylase family protein [Nitrospirae bacterium]|nr:polysaccharide deacetylase family protein [Nitrospirota bacterium]